MTVVPGREDLSDYLFHLTKGNQDEGYRTSLRILDERTLLRGPGSFGAARHIPEVAEGQRTVCFSEIPLGFLGRLSGRRGSSFGLAFAKSFVAAAGGCPLWYLEDRSSHAAAFRALVSDAATHRRFGDPIFTLTPFVDFPSSPSSSYQYDFRWEREWRLASDLSFEPADVAFLLIPEDLHDAARRHFRNEASDNFARSYTCPYVDPTWSLTRVQEHLAARGAEDW